MLRALIRSIAAEMADALGMVALMVTLLVPVGVIVLFAGWWTQLWLSLPLWAWLIYPALFAVAYALAGLGWVFRRR